MILNLALEAVGWLGELSGDVFFGTLTLYPSIALLGVVAVAGCAVAHLPLAIGRYVRQSVID